MGVRPMILRFWTGVTAGFILVVAATLMALTLVPVVLGLMSATVVGTASMAPALQVGDVVLLEDIADRAESLAPPTVVLAEDPTREELLLHRIVGTTEDGEGYLTKGDANPENDSAVLPPERVRGTGRVVIPLIGTPVLWLSEGNLTALGLVVLAIVGLSWLSRYGWSNTYDPWPTPTPTTGDTHAADAPGEDSGDDRLVGASTGRAAGRAPALGAAEVAGSAGLSADRRPPRSWRPRATDPARWTRRATR